MKKALILGILALGSSAFALECKSWDGAVGTTSNTLTTDLSQYKIYGSIRANCYVDSLATTDVWLVPSFEVSKIDFKPALKAELLFDNEDYTFVVYTRYAFIDGFDKTNTSFGLELRFGR